MAKKKSAPQGSGEGKAPLVIALAFFVIATIAAGVMAYTFEGDIAAEKKKAEDAAALTKTESEKRAIADELVRLYQVAIGTGTADDAEALKTTRFEQQLGDEHRKIVDTINGKIAAAVKADATELATSGLKIPAELLYNWPSFKQGGPATSMPDRMVKLIVEREQSLRYVTVAKTALEAAAKVAATEKTAYEADRATFKQKLDAKDAEVVAYKKKLDAELAARAAAYDKSATDFAAARKTAGDEIQPLKDELTRTKDRLKEAEATILANKAAQAQTKTIPFDNPAGSLLNTSARTNTVEIDLGSADKVRPGLTFNVYPREAKDRGSDKTAKEKAKIEVVEVVGPNLSRARVTFLDDDVRNPLVKGDLLYNAAWQKGRTDHVVLIGVFDIDGDGTDDIKAVARDLAKMGVSVDGYFDLATRKWVGAAPGYRTDYAVFGGMPTVYPNDPLAQPKTDLAAAVAAADAAAKEKGVTMIRAREFFGSIGYKMKENVSNDTINQAAAKYLKTDAAPAPAAPPAAN